MGAQKEDGEGGLTVFEAKTSALSTWSHPTEPEEKRIWAELGEQKLRDIAFARDQNGLLYGKRGFVFSLYNTVTLCLVGWAVAPAIARAFRTSRTTASLVKPLRGSCFAAF